MVIPMATDTAEITTFDPAAWIAQQQSPDVNRPWVTLSYAQSLDGCIAGEPGKPAQISSPEALVQTHGLRAAHDAILVGIGTVLADDPQLNVRLAPGADPQPVILDAYLRTPLTARLVQRQIQPTWIFHSEHANPSRVRRLSQAGVRLLPVQSRDPDRLDLRQVLNCMKAEGLERVMVEGGAEVIQSFLTSGLVDWVVITISPRWLGGVPVLSTTEVKNQTLPQIINPSYIVVGSDMIISGKVTQ
ncbi:RibD family protein [bacterium]|nr:RibD family protein [bacterium]